MKLFIRIALVMLLNTTSIFAQQKTLLVKEDLKFLGELTKTVLDSSRIYPGQRIARGFGPNSTDGTLIRPGGRDAYPAFWIRDYSMSLETGMINKSEQLHMLQLTAATQCDQTWITKNGSMVPFGAIADHIRIDDAKPIFFPGTYDFEEQGNKVYGMMPPYDDQFFFIHMAAYYVETTVDTKLFEKKINGTRLIDRLEAAFKVPPALSNHIVYSGDDYRGVDYGFRDAINITGDLCFPSLLKYRAANELSVLFSKLGDIAKARTYKEIAGKIKQLIPSVFSDPRGMLLASTAKSRQPDVWATAFAVYLGILEGVDQKKACQFLADAYSKGSLSFHGNIRHVLTSDDFSSSTAWESTGIEKNTYQNGAYWGTPTGWVCFAIAKVDFTLAQRLAKEYIDDLRENDFRKGGVNGAPYECFHPSGYKQNPIYLTTVSCPFAVFKK